VRRLPLLLLPALLPGCKPEGCLTNADGCEVPSPCTELQYTCDGGSSEVRVLGPTDPIPGGMDALGAPGDILLGNDKVVAVLDAPDHPHYIAPSGGALLDLTTRGKDNDSLRHMFQATGLLPGDGIVFDSYELFDEGDVKAAQFKGHLDGYPDVTVATRYEARPCEPGIRVRTEFVNGTPDTQGWFPTDGWYLGDRNNISFSPGAGVGFEHPDFGLSTIASAFHDIPYLVLAGHVDPAASYAEISCTDDTLTGFESATVTAMGLKPRPIPPRDYAVFERFIAAADGLSVSSAADLALEVREKLWGETYATVTGRVDGPNGEMGEGLRAGVLISEGKASTPEAERIPWTHAIPDADGNFSARVPADRDYVLDIEAFGQNAAETDLGRVSGDFDAGTLNIDAVGEVTLDVTVDGVEDHALVFVVPSDDATDAATRGDMYGWFDECAPLLGNPHGPSPACNRVLVDGPTTVAIPPGTYDFYTSAGPFSTLGEARNVTVAATTGQSVDLAVTTLPLQPANTLSGDFHVHSGASFDSQLPDGDRVKTFLAARIQVVASTEHDVVHDFTQTLQELGADARMQVIQGTESTGLILFKLRTDYGFPQVIGHWNFWPVPYDPQGPWRGAAWDQEQEPGKLFTSMRDAGWDDDAGIVELNHPLGGIKFGRDYSWASAAGFKLNEPLKAQYDGTGQSLFFHKPDDADFSNDQYDVQEVMNGTWNENFLAYRAFWFYLLNQGIVRAGTANSDSHTLTENVVGTPRNVVFTDTTLDDFDLATFDADVREGHMLGTNGPIILAQVTDGANVHPPDVEAFTPNEDATLDITVTAAPWVPVDEVRIVVNGSVAKTITDLNAPQDPFGTDGTERLTTSVPLSEILPASGDAWIVVEAGHALPEAEDLNCDGAPDTGDNNRDGVIDWRDVEGLTEDPGEDCFATVGPLANPPDPERDTPDWYFQSVEPMGYPLAFTNPFVLDRDGNGFSGVAR
jgi:hypothetical protein